jgi:hypothetical protein
MAIEAIEIIEISAASSMPQILIKIYAMIPTRFDEHRMKPYSGGDPFCQVAAQKRQTSELAGLERRGTLMTHRVNERLQFYLMKEAHFHGLFDAPQLAAGRFISL